MTRVRPTLAEFLLARIAVDEAEWQGRAAADSRTGSEPWPRLLAECEVKRAVLELLRVDCQDPGNAVRQRWAFEIICQHATIYADHPDYRDEWNVWKP